VYNGVITGSDYQNQRMETMSATEQSLHPVDVYTSFFDRPQVEIEEIPLAGGIAIGTEQVTSPVTGTGGVYGAWGQSYDNRALQELVEQRLGEAMSEDDLLNLSELGFNHRHHIPLLSQEEHIELEVQVGAHFLRKAMQALGWDPAEVDAVLIGVSAPVIEDYAARISALAGIPEKALKVIIHKACDSSTAALHMALNPRISEKLGLVRNIARELLGKKVLVGGIEGLSRYMQGTRDKNALQLFGNGAGVIGLIPGKSMKFLVGRDHEVFDEEGVLAVRMTYPHTGQRSASGSLLEVHHEGENHIRVSGMMHEPEDDSTVVMAGPMGMVKLFVRTGVEVVREVFQAYQERLQALNMPDKSIAVAIVHHANYKINKLKEKHLQREGIHIPMPWLLSDFGNVSAASNMIAFLRGLKELKPGDHVLIDGFGAGTYYDVLAVEMGGSST